MIRALLRLIALLLMALALVAAVLDVTRTVADSAVTVTALGSDWQTYAPDALAGAKAWVEGTLHPFVWSGLVAPVLALPSWVVLVALALLLGWLSRRRRARWQDRFGTQRG